MLFVICSFWPEIGTFWPGIGKLQMKLAFLTDRYYWKIFHSFFYHASGIGTFLPIEGKYNHEIGNLLVKLAIFREQLAILSLNMFVVSSFF